MLGNELVWYLVGTFTYLVGYVLGTWVLVGTVWRTVRYRHAMYRYGTVRYRTVRYLAELPRFINGIFGVHFYVPYGKDHITKSL